MSAEIKQVNRAGDLIEVVADVDGEVRRVRRNVQNYDQLTDAEKHVLHKDILGVPEIVETPTTFWGKIKAVFSHKLW